MAFGGGGLNAAAKGDILFIRVIEASLDNDVLETLESTDCAFVSTVGSLVTGIGIAMGFVSLPGRMGRRRDPVLPLPRGGVMVRCAVSAS